MILQNPEQVDASGKSGRCLNPAIFSCCSWRHRYPRAPAWTTSFCLLWRSRKQRSAPGSGALVQKSLKSAVVWLGGRLALEQKRVELILAVAIRLLVGICKHLGGQESSVDLAEEPWFLPQHCHLLHVLRELNLGNLYRQGPSPCRPWR